VPTDKQDRFCANYMRNEVGLPKKLLLCDSPTTGRHSKPPIAYSGGAGLVSTAGDFLNFSSMLLNEGKFNKIQFLKPETVILMTQNYIPENSHNFSQNVKYASPGQGYGLGFGITLDPKLEQTAGNSGTFGWSGAAHTLFFVDPKEDLIAIFLTQQLPFSYNLEMLNEFKIAVYESIYN
jgi:CubicO group peptidase (beta-lactamase class C family)